MSSLEARIAVRNYKIRDCTFGRVESFTCLGRDLNKIKPEVRENQKKETEHTMHIRTSSDLK